MVILSTDSKKLRIACYTSCLVAMSNTTPGQVVRGPYGDWETGAWSIKRHLAGGTFVLSWKIIPFHRAARSKPFSFTDKKHGIEGGWPEVSFGWIRCSYQGKRLQVPQSAYLDCFDGREFRITYENGAPTNFSWDVRELKDHVEVTTELGAHGGREWVTWLFRRGKYAGRQFSFGSSGESAPRKDIKSIS